LKSGKLIYISIATIITVALLYFFDQVMQVNYLTKVSIKLFLFSLFPAIYIVKTGSNVIRDSLKNRNRKGRGLSILLGIALFLIILLAYFIARELMDIHVILGEFEEKYKIDSRSILYYGLYITFINSLLEEFFFRGFIFLNIIKLGFRKTAYIISSLAFSVYHIANYKNWFSVELFLLASLGLFIGGCIFNALDEKDHSFFNSWFVHICADVAIVLIGLIIFDFF